MKSSLYFQSPSKTSTPQKLAGVREIMDKKGIHVQVMEEKPSKLLVARLAEFWHPLGAIVDCGGVYNDLDASIFSALPTVFIGHDPDSLPRKCLHVLHDQAATAQLAARELLETGFSNFAFVPYEGKRYWSDIRRDAFRDALSLNGKKCEVFSYPRKADDAIARTDAMRRFLESLPKPCGVFAANDKTAETVLSAAQLAGLSVPNSLAVVGVDNYEAICEHTTPPLTSIEPDFRRGGELAALMLLTATSGKGEWRGDRVCMFGPLRVVRRASSRILQRNDPKVLAALDLIRRRACSGLRAEEVARLFDCSRRMADIRFERATGHSILAEIHAVQLERAQELLRDTSVHLKTISDFCGFSNPNSLRKFFLRTTGKTMTAWRDAFARRLAPTPPLHTTSPHHVRYLPRDAPTRTLEE